MTLSDQVRFLEEKARAYEEMHKKEIEHELAFYQGNILLQDLSRYDFAPELINHFYPVLGRKNGGMYHLGLILPFRRLIFHNMDRTFDKSNLVAINEFADNNGYGIEYYEFAFQHEPVIEGLQSGELPKNKDNKGR